MLQKMGWQEGHGLGTRGRGIREPVQVYVRAAGNIWDAPIPPWQGFYPTGLSPGSPLLLHQTRGKFRNVASLGNNLIFFFFLWFGGLLYVGRGECCCHEVSFAFKMHFFKGKKMFILLFKAAVSRVQHEEWIIILMDNNPYGFLHPPAWKRSRNLIYLSISPWAHTTFQSTLTEIFLLQGFLCSLHALGAVPAHFNWFIKWWNLIIGSSLHSIKFPFIQSSVVFSCSLLKAS